jgi:hypothetical protein
MTYHTGGNRVRSREAGTHPVMCRARSTWSAGNCSDFHAAGRRCSGVEGARLS